MLRIQTDECPFIDNLVDMAVYHITGRAEPCDVNDIATLTTGFILDLLKETDPDARSRKLFQIGIGKMAFEANWRSTWNDSKYLTGEWPTMNIIAHNAFDQSENRGGESTKKTFGTKFISQQLKTVVQISDVLNQHLQEYFIKLYLEPFLLVWKKLSPGE